MGRGVAGVSALAALCSLLSVGAAPAFADPCPNAQFRVGPSASLPDCRAYEQITPADKQASQDMFMNLDALNGLTAEGLAANQGDKVLLQTPASFGPSPDGYQFLDYVFSRSSTGWTFTPLEPSGAADTHYSLSQFGQGGFSPDLSQVAPFSFTGAGSDLSDASPVSLSVGPAGGPYTTIATTALRTNFFTTSGFAAASTDFSHIFFWSTDHSLAQGASQLADGSHALYEWTGGHIQLVDVTSDGSVTSACGAAFGAGGDGSSGEGGQGSTHDSVSSDGSKVFFVSPEPGAADIGVSDPSCSQPPQLYMREAATNTTVEISCPPNVPDPNGCQSAAFVGAAGDGSKVFFVTKTELTTDDTTHDYELYEYDTASGKLTRVSRGTSGNADADVQWAIASEDGSAVYFAGFGQLAPGAPALASYSAGGTQVNLYRYDTTTGTTRYIATLNLGDGPQDLRTLDPENDSQGPFDSDSESDWYTTPDGRFLLFGSSADLTGYDPGTDCVTGMPLVSVCQELYRYDSTASSLTCVSCSGTSPAAGDAFFTLTRTAPPWSDSRPPRPMSDDGSYVFFESRDQLVPQATNHRYDVYEWHNGTVSLISSGTDPNDSLFVDSSSDGSNVFFGTHAQLAPTDTDFVSDLYDARIDGGFPAPASPPSCSGDGCQGPLSSPPAPPVAASVSFFGPANLASGKRAKVRVLSRVVHGPTFFIRVSVPRGGRITISGAGIRTVRRSVSRSGVHQLKVTLSPNTKRRLRHKHKLRLRLRVGYRSAAGGSSPVSVTLTVKS